MSKKERKPLSFWQTVLAGAVGVVVVSVVCGLLMLAMMISMVVQVSKMGKSNTVMATAGTVLNVDLAKLSGDRTASSLEQSFGMSKTVGLVDACAAIRAAATDDNISCLYLTNPATSSLSWGSLTELRQAIADFRASGKAVLSYGVGYSQPAYYLCSVADKVALHPSGVVDFRGLGAEVMYYKDLLDKLGVEMQLVRPESCAYKSAGEVYTMNHMSAANREQMRAYIGSIWRTVSAEIAQSRSERGEEMSVARLNGIADRLEGYLADDAKASSLVDTLCFEADMKAMLRADYGGKKLMSIADYSSTLRSTATMGGDAIAVIYAEGNVVDGTSRGIANAVYGGDIVKALREASDNDKVKAIVLRVNSPGGQATASESMTHAVAQAREKKPVVVSMGDLAASAGYEMSCLADVIVAQPTTVTGSIGVFATVPNIGRLMRQKLGLATDTVLTNKNAASMNIMRPLSPTAKAMMERSVEDFYRVFVGRVAEGRKMTYDEVHRIARGRVWTGIDAKKIGLVDTLGGIDLAIAIAAERAGIEKYRTIDYPRQKDTWTQLQELMGDNEQDDSRLSLRDKMRLALGYRSMKNTPLSAMERDLQYIATAEGLQARLPFVVVSE